MASTSGTRLFSEEGFDRLINDMNRIVRQFSDYHQQMEGWNLSPYEKYDREGLFSRFCSDCDRQSSRAQELWRELQNIKQSIMESIERGTLEVEQVEDIHFETSAFGPSVAAAVVATYTGYKAYQFGLNTDLSFTGSFNDWKTFVNSDFYKLKNTVETGYSMITNWSLWGKTITGDLDDVTDEWLEGALAGVLDSMPNVAPDGFEGIADWAKDVTGVKNLDSWIKSMASLAKKFAAAGYSRDEFFASEEVKVLMESVKKMDKDDLRHYMESFIDEETWQKAVGVLAKGEAAEFAERLGEDLDTLEWLDLAFSGLNHALTDHTVQMQYLDSMEAALTESGFTHGAVVRAIDELRHQYSSSLYNAAKKTWKKAKEEAVKETGKAIAGAIPGIKEANAILSTGSKTISLLAAKDIAADKALMGLRQYDEVLSRSLDGYVQKMKDNMATETDMMNAERCYELWVGTKKKEYECMIEMVGKGPARGVYQTQYNKLLEMEKEIAEMAEAKLQMSADDLMEQISGAYHT